MTGGDTILPTELKRRRWQFSLGGLMVFVFGVSVGLSAATMRGFDWGDGVVAAVLAWIILGLIHQVCDLWRAFHNQSQLTSDERWGWRFAVFWRLGVIGLLAGLCAVSILLEMAIVALPEPEDVLWSPGENLRGALFAVAVICVLSSVFPTLPSRRRGSSAHLLNLAGLAAAVVLSVLICWERTAHQALVATAIQSIEMAQPLDMAREGVEILPDTRTARFFRECSLALGLGLASLCLTYGLAHGWGHERRLRAVLVSMLVVTLPAAVVYLIWVCMFAMPRAFPIAVDAQSPVPLHVSTITVLLLLVLATAGTYRLVAFAGEGGCGPKLTWRRNERRYYHERRAVILALVVGIGAPIVIGFFMYYYYHGGLRHGWLFIPQCLLYFGLPQVAVLVAAVCAVWRLARRKNVDEEHCTSPISPRHFAAVWLGLLVSMAVVIPALVLFGFALWFSPWCRGEWP
ncbi:MAG: hypothetical protein HQ582_15755 [Planctomycetes bacterium]|nr:hypothetical protein [Planctomycetota bacterium]